MSGFQFIAFSLWVLLFGISLLLVIPARFKANTHLLVVFLVGLFTSLPALNALRSGPVTLLLNSQPLFGNVSFELDALSAWFILIINFTCLMGALYGIGYMKPYQTQAKKMTLHWISFLLFQSSMIWVCLAQNMLVFLIIWEVMSFSSLMLVIFAHDNSRILKAGLNYLIQMHIGVALISLAFIWVYLSEGSLDFITMKKFFDHHSNIWLFLLLFAGFGIKAGFMTLHSGVLRADPIAPPHVSGVMSGVIVKMGIYGILRTVTFLQADYLVIGKIVLLISIMTGLYGIINSTVHRDFRRMLTYCTIENIGIIGSGIGLGLIGIGSQHTLLIVLGFGGSLLHILNHSLYKSLLFFTAGSIFRQTGTRDMERLGGLIKKMPKTAIIFLIGAIAIGGLPPFNGFVSEFLLYSGFFAGLNQTVLKSPVLLASAVTALALIGGISIFTFTKGFGVIFLGQPRTQLKVEPVEVPLIMRLPQYIIILVMILIAVMPAFFVNQSMQIVTLTFGKAGYAIDPNIQVLMSQIGLYSILFIGIIVVFIMVRNRLVNRHPVSVAPTWGCGYIAPRPSIQYTGKSFSKSVGKMLNFMVFEQKKFVELDRGEVFPKERTHSSHYTDFFDFRIIDRVTKGLLSGMNQFQFIQNGHLQRYILYGLLFIIVIFICSFFNFI